MVVMDGTNGTAERQAKALGAFLHEGLTWAAERGGASARTDGATVAFCTPRSDAKRLVGLAPTRDVRLVRVPPRRPDLMAAVLHAIAQDVAADLIVLAGGPLGTELASRLACRTGGAVATDVIDAVVDETRFVCHRSAYSGHLTARVALGPRPWYVTAEARWYDAPAIPAIEHRIVADSAWPDVGRPPDGGRDLDTDGETGGAMAPPFTDVELLEAPRTGDLETARFLVVAGRGAGGREGVERLAAAAGRMGAAFGVTRPVVMNAWAPMHRLIGVSGTRAAPAVCLVAGVSGAPAFLWGVEGAGFIAAIDTDQQAAIVAEADLAAIDDGVAVVEALADLVVGERADSFA